MADHALPLFYGSPQVLRFEDHKDLTLERKSDFAFAATANAIPLTPGEFLPAVRHYPIVFVRGGDAPAPVAVTGLKQGQNLFVTQAGEWQQGSYIPAYVRRYPFILIQSEDKTQTVLGFDGACARITTAAKTKDGDMLFAEDGTASETTRPMIEFCNAYHQQSLMGTEFVKALQEHDLLVDKQVNMSFPDKSRYRLDGLLVVDPERFRALPAKVIGEWHEKGFTDAVVLHMASSQNWENLLQLNDAASRPKAA
ncbi:SapC family protein [Martelella mediterranea]|uniref:SapC n=1 Tax=Martelella mediterranea DSM 17316 TaxID=1122214 RepID=A0A1U9YYW2_9HYPH|nr:SapC family protein [Martelella mediterranea]AQZ50552.1 SapC [Martelella mediterranea DSM 17316]